MKIPAHKQTDPDKKPGQIVNRDHLSFDRHPYLKHSTSGRKEDVTLSDYIRRKSDAFDVVNQEKKLSFEEWFKKNFDGIHAVYGPVWCDYSVVWKAAQRNV